MKPDETRVVDAAPVARLGSKRHPSAPIGRLGKRMGGVRVGTLKLGKRPTQAALRSG
jgi:hypothetical protein